MRSKSKIQNSGAKQKLVTALRIRQHKRRSDIWARCWKMYNILLCGNESLFMFKHLLSSYHICTRYHAWQTLVSIRWRLSIMEGRKYFVEHLLCFKWSASCFTYAYSLTIKTSCKVRDFLYKWENWSSLRSHTQTWEQLRISAWSLWPQSSRFFTYSIPVQGHTYIIECVYRNHVCRVSQKFRWERFVTMLLGYFQKYSLKI